MFVLLLVNFEWEPKKIVKFYVEPCFVAEGNISRLVSADNDICLL